MNINGIGLFKWFLSQKGKVNGYSNAYWSGVTTLELSKYIIKIICNVIIPTGIVHLTNNEKITKYDLLRLIREEFQLNAIELINDKSYSVDKSFINSRADTFQNVPSYREMISELKVWMENELN